MNITRRLPKAMDRWPSVVTIAITHITELDKFQRKYLVEQISIGFSRSSKLIWDITLKNVDYTNSDSHWLWIDANTGGIIQAIAY
jgi:hypothetical protein